MNLVIDLGNTSKKLGLFQGNDLTRVQSFESITNEDIEQFCQGWDVGYGILSSVIDTPEVLISFLNGRSTFIHLDQHTPLPIKNLYETPGSLGNDRLVCAVAAAVMFPETPVLSVDAGTCIKYDIVTANGEYLGGSISPGLEMRLKAMNYYTARLPLLKVTEPAGLIGRNTEQSMLSGAMNGAVAEINGVIGQYQQIHKGLKVILTGGDASFFEDKLKSRIFAVPQLVLHGLNYILNYNVSKKK
jgi:type III pantothenate kinase